MKKRMMQVHFTPQNTDYLQRAECLCRPRKTITIHPQCPRHWQGIERVGRRLFSLLPLGSLLSIFVFPLVPFMFWIIGQFVSRKYDGLGSGLKHLLVLASGFSDVWLVRKLPPKFRITFNRCEFSASDAIKAIEHLSWVLSGIASNDHLGYQDSQLEPDGHVVYCFVRHECSSLNDLVASTFSLLVRGGDRKLTNADGQSKEVWRIREPS